MPASIGQRPPRRIGLCPALAAIALLSGSALPVAGAPSSGRPDAAHQPLVVAQATEPAPGSTDELRAAIAEIKAKLARQRSGKPTVAAQQSDIAEQLRSAGEQLTELTKTAEQLRAERDELRLQLAAARDDAAKLQASLGEQRRDADKAAAEASQQASALQDRLRDVDQAREGALAQLADLHGQLDKEHASNVASNEALAQARADLAGSDQAREAATKLLAQRVAETDAAEQQAQKLENEIASLRSAASSSVEEVRGLGEQLLAADGQNAELAAALGELRAAKATLESELAASRREAQAVGTEPGKSRPATAAIASNASAVDPTAPAEGSLPVALRADDEVETGGGAVIGGPAALLSQLELRDAGQGWMMTVPEGLDFMPGSDAIKPGTTGSLEKIARLISSYGTPAVRIVGRGGGEGDPALDRRLSQRRAQAVRTFLVTQMHVEPRLITTEGYETRSLAAGSSAAGQRQSRHIEVYLKP